MSDHREGTVEFKAAWEYKSLDELRVLQERLVSAIGKDGVFADAKFSEIGVAVGSAKLGPLAGRPS